MGESFMKLQLKDEINIDLKSLSIIVTDVENLQNDVIGIAPTNVHKTALGGFAAHFYNGIENIIKRIYKSYKIELPKGDDWHIVLLDRCANDSESNSPIKLSKDLIEKLTDYRRFRHYFFHGYGHNLNWEILSDGVSNMREVYKQFVLEMSPFLEEL